MKWKIITIVLLSLLSAVLSIMLLVTSLELETEKALSNGCFMNSLDMINEYGVMIDECANITKNVIEKCTEETTYYKGQLSYYEKTYGKIFPNYVRG